MYIPNKYITLTDGRGGNIVTGVFYTMVHKGTDSVLTFDTNLNLQNKRENLIVLKNVSQYLENGDVRNSTLIAFEETPHEGEYLLFHKESSQFISYQAKGVIYNNNTLVTRATKTKDDEAVFLLDHDPNSLQYYTLRNKKLDAPIEAQEWYNLNEQQEHFLVMYPSEEGTEIESKPAYFKFIPENFSLEASIEDFHYEGLYDFGSLAKEFTENVVKIVNQSDTNDDQHSIKFHKKYTNTATWTFNDSDERDFLCNIDTRVKPQLFELKSDFPKHFEWNTKENSLEKARTEILDELVIDESLNFVVPSNKQVAVKYILKSVDLEVPFTANVKFKCFTNRLRRDHQVKWRELDQDGIIYFLKYSGYNGPIKVDRHGVSFQIKGTVHIVGAFEPTMRRTEELWP